MAYGSVNVPGKLTAAQVGAAAANHTHTADAVGAVRAGCIVDGVALGTSGTLESTTHFGVCSTASGTAAKTVSVEMFRLVEGARIEVKFTYNNTAASPTLNVNSTGAKAIKKYGTTAPDTYMWQAGAVVEFVYDGTYWIMLGGTTATTTYYGMTKLSSSVSSTSTTLAATPSAVKQAYDLAALANTNASSAMDAAQNGTTALGMLSDHSVAIGYNAVGAGGSLRTISIGCDTNAVTYRCIAIGHNAAAHTSYSIAIGADTSAGADSGGVAFGYRANAQGNGATAVGQGGGALADGAVAVGRGATVTGAFSAALGCNTNVVGNSSVALGYGAGAFGTESVALGSGAQVGEISPYTIQLGGSGISSLRCKVSLTTTSDLRDKTDVSPVDDGAVEFLNHIQAIRYVWNGRTAYIDEENLTDEDRKNRAKYGMCTYDKDAHAAGTKKGTRVRVGVAAQEIQAALQKVYGDSSYANLVNDNFFDLDPADIPDGVENQLSVNYEGFIPFLIRAIQELDARLKELEVRNA